MPAWFPWALVALGLALAAVLAYWQIGVAEGAYLGQRIVTWLYDLTAQKYDMIKQYDVEMEAVFLGRPLAEALRAVPRPLVLDVGTGTGRLPLALFAQPGFRGQAIGIDASRRMLAIAADKLRGDAHRLLLVWRDAARLPFADGTFDAVSCLEMVEFTPDPGAQLAEVIRVLRPGGILLTTRRRGINARLMPGKTHSPAALRKLLGQLGIAHVEIMPWQVEYDLVWGLRAGRLTPEPSLHPLLALRCPCCEASDWEEDATSLACCTCRAVYLVRGGVVEMPHQRQPV